MRLSTTQKTISIAMAMKKPMCRPCRSASPQKTGSRADLTASPEIGTVGDCVFCSGPPCPKRKLPNQYATQLSMIVVITSCAPTVALRKPAIPAQTAPATAASATPTTTCTPRGSESPQVDPTHTATIRPIAYWPWPPMLKRPQRNANATASPVKISEVDCSSVCCRLYEAMLAESVVGWKIQFSPAPLKMPR